MKRIAPLLSIAVMLSSIIRKGSVCVSAFRPLLFRKRQGLTTLHASDVTTSSGAVVLPRLKAVEAIKPTNGPILVKGWVRTVRRQKTLAFVEVNDGSNLSGIQCVLSFDVVDHQTMEGNFCCS